MSRRAETDKKIEYLLNSPANQMEECFEECMQIAQTLADEVDACAANPWRYDVENAPKDGSEVLLAWKNYVGTVKAETFHWDELAETWMNDDGGFIEIGFIAFATITTPEADA